MKELDQQYTELKIFIVLAGLGIVAELNHVHIPHTGAVIDGRWAFGFMGFALLRRSWAAVLLALILSIPLDSGVPFWVGFSGNMLCAIPALLVIRPVSKALLRKWGPGILYGLAWLALVMACYQAFTTPAVWGVIAMLEGVPVWPKIMEGWRIQPFLVESILVALFSATAMVAALTHQKLRWNQRRLDHIYRVLLGIRNVNQLIVSENDPHRLINRACINLTETLGYYNTWIALLDKTGESVIELASSGLGDLAAGLKERLSRGEFPACMRRTLQRDEISIIRNPEVDCPDCGLSHAYGKRSGLSRSLRYENKTYGVLTVSVPGDYADDSEEQDLFNEVAGDLAFALHKIEMGLQLEESQKRYRGMFSRSRDGFVMVNSGGRILEANQAFCDMLGYTLDELLALEDFYQITPERWHEWEKTEIWEKRLLVDGYSGLYEKEYIRRDGTVFPVELSSYAVRDENGELEHLWGTARDISERKQAEQTLLESRAMLARTEEIANVGSWEWDIDNDSVRWSEELFRIFKREPAAKAPSFSEHNTLYEAESMERLEEAVQKCASDGTPYELELNAIRTDGSIRHCIARGRAERDATGRIFRLVGSLQDITDRKHTAEALNESLAEKTQLLRELYHRTKNNMQVIVSMLQLQAEDTENREIQEMLLDNTSRIKSMALVHEMLYQSKNLSRINLDDYIRNLAQLLVNTYQVASNKIDLVLDLEAIPVLIDTAVPCGMVLNEIISNAIKHAFPQNQQGEIRIDLKRGQEEHFIKLTVTDNGIGLPTGFDYREARTLGMKTITAIVEHQLQGTVAFEGNAGLTCKIRFRNNHYAERVSK